MIENRLEDYMDTVLYDVFYEAGTILGGWLVNLERRAKAAGDLELARECGKERLSMRRERAAVKADDRAGQIACIRKWRARQDEIDAQYPLDVELPVREAAL